MEKFWEEKRKKNNHDEAIRSPTELMKEDEEFTTFSYIDLLCLLLIKNAFLGSF